MQNSEQAFRKLIDIIKKLRERKRLSMGQKTDNRLINKIFTRRIRRIAAGHSKQRPENLCEEAGDLLFLIVMLAEINSEQKVFEITDVLNTINEKLIRRHPHVFAGVQIEDEEALRKQWQAIKDEEKSKKN